MKLSLLLSGLIIGSSFLVGCNSHPEAEFNVATYNLRQLNHSDSIHGDGWGRRLPVLASLIQFHDFDIFGTQEGFEVQLDSLSAHLPGYARIGRARDDGQHEGEHSAIFYRTDLFTPIDNGDFWLSETPDRPGLGWDAACTRICSWGHFRHNPSAKEFLFFNLHMDHVGVKARAESVMLIKDRIARISEGKPLPVIITGDFNVDQTSGAYHVMTDSAGMNDAFEVALMRYAPNGTFNAWRTDGFTVSRIDHIFVSPGVEVTKYGVLTDTYRTCDADTANCQTSDFPAEVSLRGWRARTPSDHFPVKAHIKL